MMEGWGQEWRGTRRWQKLEKGFSSAEETSVRQGKEKGGITYHGRHRSVRGAESGWRSRGFGIGGGHEAWDAELAALAYGLIHLHGRGETGVAYSIFTDSRAAMARVTHDTPGPGQYMAIRIIELAQRVIDQGNSITVRWTPAHREVEGNERAVRRQGHGIPSTAPGHTSTL